MSEGEGSEGEGAETDAGALGRASAAQRGPRHDLKF